MDGMGRHNNGTGLRGDDGAMATLEPLGISTALSPQRLVPLPPSWTAPRQDEPATADKRRSFDGDRLRRASMWGRGLRDYPWPLVIIAAPAAVAIWSGWVGLGGMCGFGPIHPLPGIADSLTINTAITLPVGVEAYGAYALAVWLGAKRISGRTRQWARTSALGALALGCLGQVAFHLLSAARWVQAPWPVVTAVSCIPVASLALAAALAHMIRADVRRAAEGDLDDSEAPREVTGAMTPEVTPRPPVQVTPKPVSGQAPKVTQVRPRRPAQAKPERISDADLKAEIRSALTDGTAPSVNAVAKAVGRGRDRVRPLLEEVRQEAALTTGD